MTWTFEARPVDKTGLGFLVNHLTGKCLDVTGAGVDLASCRFHRLGTDQTWKQQKDGTLKNFRTGQCLKQSGTAVKLFVCNGDDDGQKWNLDNTTYFLSNTLSGKCLDVTGHPAECSGNAVALNDCNKAKELAVDTDRKWLFLSLNELPQPPVGTPQLPESMPTMLASPVSGTNTILVKAGSTCGSSTQAMGPKKSLEECALAVHRGVGPTMQALSEGRLVTHKGPGKYFSYGVGGESVNECNMEVTSAASCPEGFDANPNFNFYKIDPLADAEKIDMPHEVAMMTLAAHTYTTAKIGDVIATWTVKKQCDKKPASILPWKAGHDYMTLYQKGNQCVLAFAGTDDLKDSITDVDAIGTENLCGREFHAGFGKDLKAFMFMPCWKDEFAPFLASDACSGGRITVGHSLGGALAEGFAYCANAGYQQSPNFTINEVFTCGAPGVAVKPLENKLTKDGCFAGRRFINIDGGRLDPVPAVTQVLKSIHYVHPRMPAVWLSEDGYGDVKHTDLPCNENHSVQLPVTDLKCFPDGADHNMQKYLYRGEAVYGRGKGQSDMVKLMAHSSYKKVLAKEYIDESAARNETAAMNGLSGSPSKAESAETKVGWTAEAGLSMDSAASSNATTSKNETVATSSNISG
jgi:hypothetical protein